ncbi:MAG: S41 family peptidase [Planctomycetaceae bacterium]|jgi:carboxyl-terminal processing protease|nr:S41 family peptidase [Planctomycetaceae bacterium]
MPIRNLVFLAVAAIVCLASWAARERDARARRFGEVLGHIDRAYLEPVDGEALFATAVEATVAKLDEHSAFLRGAARDDLESLLDQQFGGVGLELGIDDRTRAVTVLAPLPGSPAWRAGIVAGDVIEAIDGTATAGLPLRTVIGRLRGRPGESVRLRVVSRSPTDTLDPGAAPTSSSREVALVRETVKVESVLGDRRRPDGSWQWMLEDEPGIALVRIVSFGEHTAADLDAAIEALDREAAGRLRGLVLDLRGNPGGLLGAAVDTCDRFLDEGVIVSTVGRRAGAAEAGVTRRAEPGAALAGVRLAVLVDGLTASAAEIVAACLQDNRRATVVGSRTYGKGTVQSIVPLSDGRSLLKLTTSEYLRPSRANIHRRPGDGDDAVWGVTPDAGFEITPPAATLERTRGWRRARDLGDQGPMASAVPRSIDPVLATALRLFSRPATELGGEEETAGHAHQPAAGGE